jgi:hypothetical protein
MLPALSYLAKVSGGILNAGAHLQAQVVAPMIAVADLQASVTQTLGAQTTLAHPTLQGLAGTGTLQKSSLQVLPSVATLTKQFTMSPLAGATLAKQQGAQLSAGAYLIIKRMQTLSAVATLQAHPAPSLPTSATLRATSRQALSAGASLHLYEVAPIYLAGTPGTPNRIEYQATYPASFMHDLADQLHKILVSQPGVVRATLTTYQGPPYLFQAGPGDLKIMSELYTSYQKNQLIDQTWSCLTQTGAYRFRIEIPIDTLQRLFAGVDVAYQGGTATPILSTLHVANLDYHDYRGLGFDMGSPTSIWDD